MVAFDALKHSKETVYSQQIWFTFAALSYLVRDDLRHQERELADRIVSATLGKPADRNCQGGPDHYRPPQRHHPRRQRTIALLVTAFTVTVAAAASAPTLGTAGRGVDDFATVGGCCCHMEATEP